MVQRYDDLTPEQLAQREQRLVSHESGLRRLADPAFVARLDAQIAALDAAPPAPRLQPGEFLEGVTRRLADGPAGRRGA